MTHTMEIVRAIQENIENHGLKRVSYDEKDNSFGFTMHVSGPVSCIDYIIKVNENDFTVVVVFPLKASNEALRASISEFVNRANYGLKNGNFEFDFSDGEVRYKCFVDCEDQIPAQEVISNSIAVPSAMIKRYAPGIVAVLFGGKSPKDAVDECEKGLRPSQSPAVALPDTPQQAGDTSPDSDESGPRLPSFEEFLRMMEESHGGDEKDTAAEDDDEPVD